MLWQPLLIHDKNIEENTFQKLIDDRCPALVFRKFCDKTTCKTIANRISDFSCEDYGSGEVKKVGVFLTAFPTKKRQYFIDAKKAEKTLTHILGHSDPRKKIHELLSKLFAKKVDIAKEGRKRYASAIIRIHENGDPAPLHRDNVNFEAKGFSVIDCKHQLSCVLHIQEPERGGELVIYKRLWRESDEKFRSGGFGYSSNVIQNDTQMAVIKPETGNLVIINPNHFHQIQTIRGRSGRIILGMFAGIKNQKIVTWS